MRPRDRELMLDQAGELSDPRLRFLRMRRAQLLVADPSLPDPDADELTLWIGLHNVLVFDHPDRRRVWSRQAAWRRVEGATRSMLTLPRPESCAEALVRHVSVGALVELRREDTVVATPAGELRTQGQPLPRRGLRLLGTEGIRQDVVGWLEQPHAPEAQRMLEDAMRCSPLTSVVMPLHAPPGWSPLWAAEVFSDRALVRAICHRWARQRDWVAVGGAVAGALLPSIPDPDRAAPVPAEGQPLALPGLVLPTDPTVLSGVVGALCHLHFLKVLELDARLGVAAVSRDPGVTAFLALPLLLPYLSETIGSPLGFPGESDEALGSRDRVDAPIARRWTEYLDHLQELVPRSAVDKLLASLVPRIVQTS
ncbi:MAG: hypothetical protein K0V04_26780 [Deltaproteobacteria bacterium]|nr:hypothetical protein [Deltaproteobacteria bacterium]